MWDEPYAVALTKGSLEVRVLKASESDKDTLIQTMPGLKDARFLLRSKQHYILVASSKTLWYLQAVDIPTQRRHLLQQKKFHLALQLTVSFVAGFKYRLRYSDICPMPHTEHVRRKRRGQTGANESHPNDLRLRLVRKAPVQGVNGRVQQTEDRSMRRHSTVS